MASTYELSGRVVDEFTDEGLGDASVTFTSDTGMTQSTHTGSSGRYELLVDSESPFGQVRAERDGYAAAEATVYFDTETRRIDLRLRPSE